MASGGELRVLLNILGEKEYETLSPEGIQKLECHLNGLQNQIEEIKGASEKYRVESEQRNFELESQVIAAKGQYEGESRKNQELLQAKSTLEEGLKSAQEKIEEMEKQLHELTLNKSQLETSKSQLELEKNDLLQMLEKKSQETESLYEEWKTISDKVGAANATKVDALAKLEEIQSKEASSKHRQERLQQERDHLQRQNTWLEGELTSKTEELLNKRKDLSSRFLEANSQLEEKKDELTHQQNLVEDLRTQNEEKAKRIEAYIQKVNDARESQLQIEEQFKQEIQSQKKLINLYRSSSEESDGKVKELLSAVAELQKIVHDASEATQRLESEAEEKDEEWRSQVREKEEVIAKQQKELENANDLIAVAKRRGGIPLTEEGIEAMSPTAAAASRLLKSGMTLTQIYSEYVQTTDALQVEKEENRRLNQYLEQILEEIEEKTPVMKKQREDYEAALQTINQMTSQLDTAMIESEKTRIELDEHHRRVGHLGRENKRLQQQANDLGLQVRMLVKELEEARGTCVSTSREDANVSIGEVSSSSSIITEKLVTFKSIEELQEQNQKLLHLVRELSEKKEEEEKEALDVRTSGLKKELDEALTELNEMKSARSRQAEMVESVVRQRDMYRVLLTQTATMPIPTTPLNASTPAPKAQTPPMQSKKVESPVSDQRLKEATNAIKDMQEELSTYKKERANNEKLLNEQVEKARQELSDQRVQNAKLASQLDYSVERFNIVQKNCESYKKEITALRDKNQQYTASVSKHEQTVNSLREDLMAATEKLTKSRVQSQNLRTQLDIAKTTTARLEQEHESMHREHLSQNVVMANLQAIQNNLERQEFEMKTKSKHQQEAMEKEAMSLRRQIAMAEGEIKALNQRNERDLQALEQKFTKEATAHFKTKDELSDAYARVHILGQEKTNVEVKLAAAERKLTQVQTHQDSKAAVPDPEAESEEIKDLKAQIDQASAEITALRDQVNTSKQHAEQYKSIADSIEARLKEQNEVSEKFKTDLEARMATMVQENNRMKHLSEGLEKERHDLLAENIRISEESHKLNAELRRQLASTQNELVEAVKRREEAIVNEQNARTDCQAQVKVASEATDKYEKELIHHAADMEALVQLRKDLAGFNEKLNEAQEDASKSKNTLESSKMAWEEQEKMYRGEYDELQKRYAKLGEQNDVLHEQMQKMSSDVINIQQAQQRQGSSDASFTEESQKSSEQLLEVIRFLRREKEIAETKSEYSTAESNRLRQKAEYLDKQVVDLNKNLAEERQSKQVSLQTAVEHTGLMKKVENLNLLTDSNKMLREEKERLTTQVKELETKVNKLEEDMQASKDVNRGLSAQRIGITAEKTTLQAEVERWKKRVNDMIEQSNKTDPEERKKLISEREELRKQLAQSKEELHRVKAEQSRSNMTMNNNLKIKQNELNAIKQQLDSKTNDIQILKKAVSERQAEIDSKKVEITQKDELLAEKERMLNQLKRLGRKYRTAAEEKEKEIEVLKVQIGQQQAQTQAQPAITEEQLKIVETALKTTKEKLTALETELVAEKMKMQSMEKEKTDAQQKCQQFEKELKAQRDETIKKDVEISRKDAEITKRDGEIKTRDAEIAKRDTEITKRDSDIAKKDIEIAQRDAEIAKKEAEITKKTEEIAKKASDLEKVSTDTDANKDGKSKEEFAELRKKNADMMNMLQVAKKRITTQKEQIEKLSTENSEMKTKVTSAAATGESDSNVRSQLESKVKELETQAQAMQTSHQTELANLNSRLEELQRENADLQTKIQSLNKELEEAKLKLSQQEAAAGTIERAVSAAAKATPRANIQPISTPSPVTSRQSTAVQPVAGSSGIKATASIKPMAIASTPTPTATVMPTLHEQGSTSQEAEEADLAPPVATVQGSPQEPAQSTSKRPREETETVEEPDQQTKRTRTTVDQTEPTSTSDEVGDVQVQEAEVDEVTEGQGAEEEADDEELETEEPSMRLQISVNFDEDDIDDDDDDDDDDEVIIVESDDDDDGHEDMEEEGSDESFDEEEFEGDMGEEGDFPEAIDTQEYEGDEGMEDTYPEAEEEMEGEDDDDDDSDDVVIVEDDDDDDEQQGESAAGDDDQAQSTTAAPDSQQPSSTGVRQIAPLPRLAGRAERLPSAGRAQLTPFSFGPQGGGFEDGDDCTVPSTPTLSLPKRSDGFAEAVSSPQVPNARFVFGSGSDAAQQSELAQLASQGALGMDDTKMDLSQFDEGNRVTITSGVVSTPNIVITSEGQVPVLETGVPIQEIGSERVTESQSQETGETTRVSEPAGMPISTISGISTVVSGVVSGGLESMQGSAEGDDGEHYDGMDTGGQRTRIQRIVWDQPVQRVASQPQQPPQGHPITSVGTAQGIPPQQRRGQMGQPIPRRGQMQRGAGPHRGAPRGHQRGRGMRGTARRSRRPPQY